MVKTVREAKESEEAERRQQVKQEGRCESTVFQKSSEENELKRGDD